MDQGNDINRLSARKERGELAQVPPIHKEDASDGGRRKITRRTAFLMLVGGMPAAAVCCRLRQPRFDISDPLPWLEKQLIQAVENHQWWTERSDSFDSARRQVDTAWEQLLTTEQRIGAVTATNMRELMVQAQTLATRHMIGFLDEHRLVDAFIRGVEILHPKNDRPSTSDKAVLSTCRDWNEAIDEVEAADLALEQIQISEWAICPPEYVYDPAHRTVIEAEQHRTGWRTNIERLWAARDRLEATEQRVALTTASSFTALLAQARPITRRLAPVDCYSVVTARIGLALVRGLERLGGRRTRDLHGWWGTEADDPPMPNY
ncbi:MAG: hypothetical protein O2992_10760 [Gemmatimonadetes bacterium]|nr:hypothetical protein [Gemmatimonadota bacterium]